MEKMAAVQGEEEDPNKELSIDEEYELWRSNVPLMYDFVSETRLTWPSLSLEWLPQEKSAQAPNRQELIIGTHTSGEEDNYLKIAAIDLPNDIIPSTEKLEDQQKGETTTKSNIKIIKKFKHEEEITRARYMPQNSNLVATINGSGKVFLYDRSKDKHSGLVSTFEYHKENGYGLSFNCNDAGKLLSGSDDGTIALWNVNNSNSSPIYVWSSVHSDIVNDCKWSNFDLNVFGSVSEDSTLQLHDQREKDTFTSQFKVDAPFNTLAFSKHSQYLFAAAGTDSHVYLFDRRDISRPLHSMAGHDGAVTNMEFSPDQDGILMTSGEDRRAIIWDICDIGVEQIPDDAEDGAPEVLMIHAGHRSAINDFSMNPNIPWLMASSEEENIIQVWKCSHKLPRVGGTPTVSVSQLE